MATYEYEYSGTCVFTWTQNDKNSNETTKYVIYTKWLICKNAVLLEMLRIREVHVEHISEFTGA